LYFLVMFYESSSDILAPYKPIMKFICVKAVIFFAFWQGVVISAISAIGWISSRNGWTVGEISTATQNFLICLEMLPIAFAFYFTFGYQTYADNRKLRKRDIAKAILSNLGHALIPTDTAKESVNAVKLGPQRNVIVGDFLHLSLEEQRKHILKEGWMEKKGEDLVKVWKKRYFAALNRPEHYQGLIYFKRNPFDGTFVVEEGKALRARGFIDFNEVTSIMKVGDKRFWLITAARKWKFQAPSTSDRDTWISVVQSYTHVQVVTRGDDEELAMRAAEKELKKKEETSLFSSCTVQ